MSKINIMTSCFKVHIIKISLIIESPTLKYFDNTIAKNIQIKQNIR